MKCSGLPGSRFIQIQRTFEKMVTTDYAITELMNDEAILAALLAVTWLAPATKKSLEKELEQSLDRELLWLEHHRFIKAILRDNCIHYGLYIEGYCLINILKYKLKIKSMQMFKPKLFLWN